jgi:hypothetical protein
LKSQRYAKEEEDHKTKKKEYKKKTPSDAENLAS